MSKVGTYAMTPTHTQTGREGRRRDLALPEQLGEQPLEGQEAERRQRLAVGVHRLEAPLRFLE